MGIVSNPPPRHPGDDQFDTLAALLRLMADPVESEKQIERLKEAVAEHRQAEAAARQAEAEAEAEQIVAGKRIDEAVERHDELAQRASRISQQESALRDEQQRLAADRAAHERAVIAHEARKKELDEAHSKRMADLHGKHREADIALRRSREAEQAANVDREFAAQERAEAEALRKKHQAILAVAEG